MARIIMAEKDQASENENWKWLREEAVVILMDLLDAQDDLARQIEMQRSLVALFESLLKPPE